LCQCQPIVLFCGVRVEHPFDVRVIVLTSDRYQWALRPFAYLFNIYWSSLQPVTVAGFASPPFPLPTNFAFHQIHPQNYPAERWSDALILLLRALPDSHLILLLEDYWLTRTADVRGIATLADYARARPDVLRIDLTADRLYAGGMLDLEAYGSYDLIETPADTPYQMSLQAAIWRREHLLSLLVPGRSAWETEIYTAPPPALRVLGTRQWPLRYANAILKGKVDPDELARIPAEHRAQVAAMIPPGWQADVPGV
jgi:hypothetical protein